MSFEPRSLAIVIQNVRPSVDCGRWPVKREVGDHLAVSAEAFKEGHGVLRVLLRIRSTPPPVPFIEPWGFKTPPNSFRPRAWELRTPCPFTFPPVGGGLHS